MNWKTFVIMNVSSITKKKRQSLKIKMDRMDRMEPYKWAGALGSDVKAISVIKKGRWFTWRQNLTDIPTDELTISQNGLFDLMTRPRVTNYVIGKLNNWWTDKPADQKKTWNCTHAKRKKIVGKLGRTCETHIVCILREDNLKIRA